MRPIPLIVLQYWSYQYEQIEGFIKSLGPCVIVARQTVEEKNNGTGGGRGYRIVNQNDLTLGDTNYNENELNAMPFTFSYVLFTGKPFKGLEKLAEKSEQGVSVYISHSLICSRYDSSLVLPDMPRSIGLVPHCWTKFTAFHKEAESRPKGRYLEVGTLPLAISSIETPPNVEVQNQIGLIFGCLSAFKSYRNMAKKLIAERPDIERAVVKFHPLTDMTDLDVVAICEDEDFVILPTDSDKYDFTDSCLYLIGGCSSLLIEAVLRNKYYERGQHISKFKEKRGIDLNMPEDTVDPDWTGKVPHEHMVDTPESIDKMYFDQRRMLESLYFDEAAQMVRSTLPQYPTYTVEHFLRVME